MSDISNKLESVRKQLLDLSMRNRLLNYRPSRVRTVRMIDELPEEIFDILVLQGKEMEFLPMQDIDSDIDDDPDSGLSIAEQAVVWQLPEPDAQVLSIHRDLFLQTPDSGPMLQRRLFLLENSARTIVEERGYSVLYIALGFLRWDDQRLAPLILIPARLHRKAADKPFKICWDEGEVVENISLRAKMSEQGIELPPFSTPESKEELIRYYSEVGKVISKRQNWLVVNDTIADLFSFSRFVMYRDLDPTAWPEGHGPEKNPLLCKLLGNTQPERSTGFDEAMIDTQLEDKDLYHVKDADPSQIAVIETIKAGTNLVVEGPPGTGKSQTITNLIAELLAGGKTVLFVSQKLAALEVVKQRLDDVGLGDYCLELHSHKSSKRLFLDKIRQTLSLGRPGDPKTGRKFTRLRALKKRLNSYAAKLRQPIGVQSFYSWYEEFEENCPEVMPQVKYVEPLSRCGDDYELAIVALDKLAAILPEVRPPRDNPWHATSPGLLMPSDLEGIERLLKNSVDRITTTSNLFALLAEKTGIAIPATAEAADTALQAAEVIAASQPLSAEAITNRLWSEGPERAGELINQLEAYQATEKEILTRFHSSALFKTEAALVEMLARFKDLGFRILRWFYPSYWRLRAEIAALYEGRLPDQNETIVQDLTHLIDCVRQGVRLFEAEAEAIEYFGGIWEGRYTDTVMLEQVTSWLLPFRRFLDAGVLTSKAVDIVSAGADASGIAAQMKQTGETASAARGMRDMLSDVLNPELNLEKTPFDILLKQLALWLDKLDRLVSWSQYVEAVKQAQLTPAAPILRLLEEEDPDPLTIEPMFRSSFAEAVLRAVFAEDQSLSGFVSDEHERHITAFARLDRRLIRINRQRLVRKLHQQQPQIRRGGSDHSEAGILRRQLQRKRGHLPIRQLMSHSGHLIQQINPCFMMSPLSAAHFLAPESTRFDVVIFDEASQVRPEDALGALLRGNQVAVFGDSKQLPPTSFFDSMLGNDDEEENALSLLEQCAGIFPSRPLRWHYRSSHESLIAVSNQLFYNNQLLVYPSAQERSGDLGLEFCYHPETVYGRGKGATNRLEAKIIAEAVIEHFLLRPELSLGVGAFSIRQQQVIREEVELLLRQNPGVDQQLRRNTSEPFFVKNLETIQGDERDVILLSIGYGFDRERRLSMNFGPLNREGGERRLNVLITRARRKCRVFANFRSSELVLKAGASAGLHGLKAFLAYAEQIESTTEANSLQSSFFSSVKSFLEQHGYEVRTGLGSAGFFIDLAVRRPGSTWSHAIETDGPKYHSTGIARERDRQRREALERMGWQVVNLWWPDWFRKRKLTGEKLLSILGSAGSSARRESSRIYASDSIRRETEAEQAESYLDQVSAYCYCKDPGIPVVHELHETEQESLITVVARVVGTESPVLIKDVVNRIRSFWHMKRAGTRAREIIHSAIQQACRQKIMHEENGFLFIADQKEIIPRRRSSPHIDEVCDQEIGAAALLVVRNEYALPPDSLAVQVSRVFGLRVTSEKTAQHIIGVVQKMVAAGKLKRLPNAMISI